MHYYHDPDNEIISNSQQASKNPYIKNNHKNTDATM